MKIIQFGYSVKVPQGIPLVDCRVIPNPFKIKDPVAQKHMVESNPQFPKLVAAAAKLLETHPVIGVGCAYGKHRSGMVVDALCFGFEDQVQVERWGKA